MSSQEHGGAPEQHVEMAPDPDEDDLDDLDEMLDEFSAAKITPTAPEAAVPTASTASTAPTLPAPTKSKTADDDPGPPPLDEDDFANQLQAGMADMLKELESNPDMAKQFQEMMASFGAPPPPPAAPVPASTSASASPITNATRDASTAATASSTASDKPSEDAFQDTIRKTMERMNQSSTSAAAATAGGTGSEDDMIASLLKGLQEGGAGGDDQFSSMLLGMMEQLTNKSILYEPMKELDSKFPAWLAEKGGSLPREEKARYQEQQSLVKEIVARFERPGYSDENSDDREFIVERMQKMQAAGAPPPDLVGDVNAAQDMMGDLDQGCAQQ